MDERRCGPFQAADAVLAVHLPPVMLEPEANLTVAVKLVDSDSAPPAN